MSSVCAPRLRGTAFGRLRCKKKHGTSDVPRPHEGSISHGGPELEPRVLTCPGHPGGDLTWWSRAGTMCFHVSRPH
eukprot:3872600-Pyramimonas_sp.AAC.1